MNPYRGFLLYLKKMMEYDSTVNSMMGFLLISSSAEIKAAQNIQIQSFQDEQFRIYEP
jgi:hypothetical protein